MSQGDWQDIKHVIGNSVFKFIQYRERQYVYYAEDWEHGKSWSIQGYYYIPNCKRPITSHHSYHVTVHYPTVLYSWYWTVVIAQLSAVDLPCKVNDTSSCPRKASEWGAGSFRLIVCKQNTSVNILFIINNIITYALQIVLIN